MTKVPTLILSFIALTLGACGSTPARTATTTSDTVVNDEGGAQTRQQTSETVETAQDGSQSSQRTETTQTTTPANPQN